MGDLSPNFREHPHPFASVIWQEVKFVVRILERAQRQETQEHKDVIKNKLHELVFCLQVLNNVGLKNVQVNPLFPRRFKP